MQKRLKSQYFNAKKFIFQPALLFFIEYVVELREKFTVTGKKAYWVVPTMKKNTCALICDLSVELALVEKKKRDLSISDPEDPSFTPKYCALVKKTISYKLADKLFNHGVYIFELIGGIRATTSQKV